MRHKSGRAISPVIDSLLEYVRKEKHLGFDPYDLLASKYRLTCLGKWPAIILTQLHKRNPFNLRALLGIPKLYNAKGIGLFLRAYCILFTMTGNSCYLESAKLLFESLVENAVKEYQGYCWGLPYAYASPSWGIVPANTPSAITTVFVMKGIQEYYKLTGATQALDALKSSCEYILGDLHIHEDSDGVCFSYTHLVQDFIFNANIEVAEQLALVSSLISDRSMMELAVRAADFTIAHQHNDGHWNYSWDPLSGRERKQIDFHQGYMVEALHLFMRYSGRNDQRYYTAVEKGLKFYRENQFYEDGRSKWRIPKNSPVDIHNQAQGIITFSVLNGIDKDCSKFAEKIVDWTIGNMWDKRGFFHYQKHTCFANRISYIRWAQAWMLLALLIMEQAQNSDSFFITGNGNKN